MISNEYNVIYRAESNRKLTLKNLRTIWLLLKRCGFWFWFWRIS